MKRKNILIRFGSFAAALLMLVWLLNSCTKQDQAAHVDFTIDLTQPQYSQLCCIGGSVVINNIIIIKDINNNYDALSAYCTYDEQTLQFLSPFSFLSCPGCGSEFSASGAVTFGRAQQPLLKYNTQLIGSSLRVYS